MMNKPIAVIGLAADKRIGRATAWSLWALRKAAVAEASSLGVMRAPDTHEHTAEA
jgi:hypothetical protein